MKVLGLIPAYNEEDCIRNGVLALRKACDEVHVFDHGSKDKTSEIAKQTNDECDGCEVVVHYVDRTEVPPRDKRGFQSQGIWNVLGHYALSRVDDIDWVILSNADLILREPDGKLATKAGLQAEHDKGTQVIRPLIRNFRMTEADDMSVDDYLLRMKRCQINAKNHSPRAWRVEMTPHDMPLGAHIQDKGPKLQPFYGLWPNGTVVSNNEWLLDHYPFRTIEQATRKVVADRDWLMPNGKRRYHQHFRENGSAVKLVHSVDRRMTNETRNLEMPCASTT